MSNTQLPSLSQILRKGAPGGHEFAHIIRMLFEAEENSGDGFQVKNFDDCSGDIDGADAFINQRGRLIRVQIKFYPSPFKPEQRSRIIEDYNKVKGIMSEDEEWMLITPDGLQQRDMIWFNDKFRDRASHKGEPYLTALFFKHPEVGQQAYPNHEFKKLVKEYETPKDAEGYFMEYIKPEADVERLFANAQPTYYDCKRVFIDEWWELMGDVYNEFYRDLISVKGEKEKLKTMTKVKVSQLVFRTDESSEKSEVTNQTFKARDILKKDAVHYKIAFTDSNNGDYSYNSWLYLNGRWVFFGKIQRFFRTAQKVRNGEDLRSIMAVLKCFRARRLVKDKSAVELRLLAGEIVRQIKKG